MVGVVKSVGSYRRGPVGLVHAHNMGIKYKKPPGPTLTNWLPASSCRNPRSANRRGRSGDRACPRRRHLALALSIAGDQLALGRIADRLTINRIPPIYGSNASTTKRRMTKSSP